MEHPNNCLVCKRIALCQAGTNPYFITETVAGYLVFGDSQFFEGYCLLLSKEPVEHLDQLSPAPRDQFLSEVGRIGAVLRKLTGAARINYEILGNKDHHLHCHFFPRRLTDPFPEKPVWNQLPIKNEAAKYAFNAKKLRALRLGIIKNLR